MDQIRKLYVKADGFTRGQTMAEYALILAAVAVVVFVGYQTMGIDDHDVARPRSTASSNREPVFGKGLNNETRRGSACSRRRNPLEKAQATGSYDEFDQEIVCACR